MRAPGLGRVAARVDAPAVLVVSTLLLAGVVASYVGVRASTWAVMTDELQVARLATSIADDLSLVPTIRGEYYAAHSQLYPLLLAPLYGALSAPAAASAAHVLNVILLLGAAVPAFLLARSVAGSTAAGYVAALLTAITPWLVLSSTLLTENAAYPAFTWSLYLCQRSLARPSTGRDAAALAGLALAFLARTQLLVVALALPVGLILTALLSADRRGAFGRLAREHRVLVVAYGVGLLVATALFARGSAGGIVGNYTVPFEGELVPPGFVRACAEHLVQVALGVGVVPVVLSLAWVGTALCRPARREANAFVSLYVVLVPLLLFVATSFDLRFTPEAFIQDRYLVYLVPLFAVGTGAWLTARRHLRTRLVATGVAAAACVALLRFAPSEETVIFWASPAAASRPALADMAAYVGISDVALAQVATLVAVAALTVLSWRARRASIVIAAVALTVVGAAQAGHVLDRYVEPAMVREGDGRRDWIDRSLADEAEVAIVPGGTSGPVPWWEAEHWNASVTRELHVEGGPLHTPFPVHDLVVDDRTGRLIGPQPTPYLVVGAEEKRFGLVESVELARRDPLRLVRVPLPYRLTWATRGLTPDGWLRPGRPARLRLFGTARAEQRAVQITFAASARSRVPPVFSVRASGAEIRDTVGPGGARPPVEVVACIPAHGIVDVELESQHRVVLGDGRAVAVHVERIELSLPWPCVAS